MCLSSDCSWKKWNFESIHINRLQWEMRINECELTNKIGKKKSSLAKCFNQMNKFQIASCFQKWVYKCWKVLGEMHNCSVHVKLNLIALTWMIVCTTYTHCYSWTKDEKNSNNSNNQVLKEEIEKRLSNWKRHELNARRIGIMNSSIKLSNLRFY